MPLIAIVGLTSAAWAVLMFRRMTRLQQEDDRICGANCLCTGPSVSYLGWDGSVHELDIVSRAFAVEFMRANRKKLVNPDYALTPLLDAPSTPVAT